jgi:hypothetical protein
MRVVNYLVHCAVVRVSCLFATAGDRVHVVNSHLPGVFHKNPRANESAHKKADEVENPEVPTTSAYFSTSILALAKLLFI